MKLLAKLWIGYFMPIRTFKFNPQRLALGRFRDKPWYLEFSLISPLPRLLGA